MASDQLQNRMRDLSVNTIALPAKRTPGHTFSRPYGSRVQFQTNILALTLIPNISYWKYDVRMYLVFKGQDNMEHVKEITKQSRDDYPEQERKTWAVELYKYMLREKEDIFPKNKAVFYDRAAVLFTANEKMRISEKEETFKLPTSALSNCPHNADEIRVVIKQVSDTYQTSSNDLKKTVSVRNIDRDKALLEVLNLATSQEGYLATEKFVTYGTGNHYLYDPYNIPEVETGPQLADGKYMGIGISKSVKVLEGHNKAGEGSAFVVADVMKSAFHYDNQNLFEKISQLSIFIDRRTRKSVFKVEAANEPRNRSSILQMIKGLFVITLYKDDKQRTKTFCIGGLGPPASEIRFSLPTGETKTVAQYYAEKYQKLRYPNLFTVTDRYKPNNFYPVELLKVALSQRVTQQQQTNEEKALMIKASAMNPKRRFDLTQVMIKELRIEPGNDILAKAGIAVATEFKQVEGRVLPHPKIVYGNNKKIDPTDNCKWNLRDAKFLNPISLKNWAVCTLVGIPEARSLKTKEYVELIQTHGHDRGMTVSKPELYSIQQATEANIRSWFEKQKKAGKEFLMFICSEVMKMSSELSVHEYLKLLEVEFQIVTQQILSNKVTDVVEKKQYQTLDNVLAKINLKLGGVNHNVVPGAPLASGFNWLVDKGSLIVGFSFSNPPPIIKGDMDKGTFKIPSVLGWSANCSKNHQSFIGDYIYVPARQSDMMGKQLNQVIVTITERFRVATGQDPRHILLYFSGISEGQWAMIADSYMEVIRNGLSTMSLKTKPKLVAVASSNDHNERIYRPGSQLINGARPVQMNIPPGTVVDTEIVSPVINEFFLNSHSAFQGTARTPKYSLVYDDSQIPMDSLEIITHCLCFLHAIVPATTADPVPLIVAARNAQRGHDIFIARSKLNRAVALTIDEANEKLVNKGDLRGVRYNA